MFKSVGDGFQGLLGCWTRWVTAKPWLIVVLSVILSLASLYFLSQKIAIDTSTGDMLSEELDFRKFNKEMDEAFPQFSDTLLVVIDGQTIDLADAAAQGLAGKMRTQPELFGDVYDLAGEHFFQKNGLMYLDIDALYDLSDQLAESQPFLASLWRDPSLKGLLSLLEKAISSQPEGSSNSLGIKPFFDRIRAVAEAQLNNQFAELSWRAVMQGNDAQNGPHRRFLLIQPALNFGSLQPASDVMDATRTLLHELKLNTDKGLRVRLTGSAALEQEELESVEEGMGLAGLLSFVLVMALLIIGLRSGWMVFSCLVTLIMGLIWTAAFAIAALGSLNLISVAFAVLFIGLSVDFGIHYALRYLEGHKNGLGAVEALIDAARKAGGALTLSAIGAAIAFFSFLPTDYNGLAELGLIAGTGMFIALFANLTVLPALLVLRPLSKNVKTNPDLTAKRQGIDLDSFVTSRYRSITWLFVGLAMITCFALPRVEFDFDPLNLKNQKTESMSTLVELMKDSRTSPYTIDILAKDLQAGVEIANKLSKLSTVENAETIADYVPLDQEEKRDVISTMALFLGPAFSSKQSSELSETSPNEALNAFIGKLENKSAIADTDELTAVLKKVAAIKDGAEELQRRLLAHLPAQLSLLKTSLNANLIDLGSLPESLRQRKVATDGRVVVEVFPKFDVTDQQQLIRFVDEVRSVAPKAIGSPVVILEAGRAILGAFYKAGAVSVLLIALLLFMVLGNVRDVLLVFAPLVVAGLFTLAASVLFGLAFNFANVIVLPLLFGLGVAGAIHLVIRARKNENADERSNSSTSRAILFSALTTIGSFGSIALSAHPGTASMGVLLTIAISLTLTCTLIFLPALMAYEAKNKGSASLHNP